MKKNILIEILLLATIFCVNANDSFSYREAESGLIVLIQNDNIAMEYESLEYNYDDREYSVTYRFRNNTDSDETLLLAFPVSSHGYIGLEREYHNTVEEWLIDTHKFKTYINGILNMRKLEKLNTDSSSFNYDYAFTLDIEIPKNSILEINDVYNSKGNSKFYYNYYYPSTNDLKTQIFYSEVDLDYILLTANNWKGDIKSFSSVYTKKLISPYVSINNNIYAFNNDHLLSFEFSSNYSEMVLNESDEPNQFSYSFSKYDFSPEENLSVSTIEKKTSSINAMLLAGSIYSFINGDEYSRSHMHYILEMLDYIYAEDLFDDILYLSLKEMDGYFSSQTTDEIFALEMVTLSRFYLNLLFAKEGYRFSNKKWEELFQYYSWYNPTTKNVNFDPMTNEKVEEIKILRSKYQEIIDSIEYEIDLPSLKIENQGK